MNPTELPDHACPPSTEATGTAAPEKLRWDPARAAAYYDLAQEPGARSCGDGILAILRKDR